MALQAYGRVALMDDGPNPEIRVSAYSDEGGHVDIPLVTFARTKDEEAAEMHSGLAMALGGRPTSRDLKARASRH